MDENLNDRIEPWADLYGADLSEADLRRADLSGANLDQARAELAPRGWVVVNGLVRKADDRG